VHCTNISPKFAFRGQRSKVKVTRNKKYGLFFGVVPGAQTLCGMFFRSGSQGRCYGGGKISACYLVFALRANEKCVKAR